MSLCTVNKSLVWVTICLDVEDPVNALADDAARDLANLLSEVGVRGTFCVTGDKCRVLRQRERQDVIHALSHHCLGLHTDTHSVHPTTMERYAAFSYPDGCREALLVEGRGVEVFEAAFGQTPTFWGGAGNTWSPEVAYAASKLGFASYAYALTELPDRARHRFNGCFAMPQDFSVSETDWAKGIDVQLLLDKLRPGHQCLFLGHPTKFRHDRFWDYGYHGGVNPDPVPLTEPLPESVYRRSLERLRAFLEELQQVATVIGMDEALQLHWRYRKPTESELEFFRVRTAKNLKDAAGWPTHRPDLEVDNIIAKTLALSDTLEVAEL